MHDDDALEVSVSAVLIALISTMIPFGTLFCPLIIGGFVRRYIGMVGALTAIGAWVVLSGTYEGASHGETITPARFYLDRALDLIPWYLGLAHLAYAVQRVVLGVRQPRRRQGGDLSGTGSPVVMRPAMTASGTEGTEARSRQDAADGTVPWPAPSPGPSPVFSQPPSPPPAPARLAGVARDRPPAPAMPPPLPQTPPLQMPAPSPVPDLVWPGAPPPDRPPARPAAEAPPPQAPSGPRASRALRARPSPDVKTRAPAGVPAAVLLVVGVVLGSTIAVGVLGALGALPPFRAAPPPRPEPAPVVVAALAPSGASSGASSGAPVADPTARGQEPASLCASPDEHPFLVPENSPYSLARSTLDGVPFLWITDRHGETWWMEDFMGGGRTTAQVSGPGGHNCGVFIDAFLSYGNTVYSFDGQRFVNRRVICVVGADTIVCETNPSW